MGLKELGEFRQDINGKRGWEKGKVVLALLGWWFMALSGLWGGVAALVETGETDKAMKALRTETQLARDDAKAARYETDALKERQKFRTITAEQKDIFLREVKDAPKGKVVVAIGLQDADVLQLVKELKSLLFKAGYEDGSNGGTTFVPDGASNEGLVIQVWSATAPPRHAQPIQRALGMIGMEAPALAKPDLNGEIVEIVVGRKPQ
jgi:hypothetical protein